MIYDNLLSTNIRQSLETVPIKAADVITILVFFLLVRYVANRSIDRVMKSLAARASAEVSSAAAARVRTLGSLLKSTIFYVLVLVAIIMLLDTLNVDTKPILTAAGVLGVAIGFGAQKFVKDMLAGFFIVLEDQYGVGEYVTIGTVTGTVVELGMRATKLRDDVGKIVFISNGDITMVTNHSRGPMEAIVDFSVIPGADLERVRSIIDAAGLEVATGTKGVLTPPKAGGIVEMDGVKITIRVTGGVSPGCGFDVQNALREAVLFKFEEQGIKLAKPLGNGE
jgi:small conductance mechanosensitive channel